MTREEIEKAIKNGESVWYIVNNELAEIDLSCNLHEIKDSELLTWYDKYSKDYYTHRKKLEDLYKSQAEAEHYLHHANVTRTEQLPFYTFSEIAKDEKNFKMGKTYTLIEDKNFVLDINKSYVSQIVLYTGKEKYSWNFNEENFYKAYDECVRLFKQGE